MTLAEYAAAHPDTHAVRVYTNPSQSEIDVWARLHEHRGWPARDAAPVGTVATVALVVGAKETGELTVTEAVAALDKVYGRTVRAGVEL